MSADTASEGWRLMIERTLRDHGADSAMCGYVRNKASLSFTLPGGVMIRMDIDLPDPEAEEFRLTPSSRRPRSLQSRRDVYEQAVRLRWRALAIAVKAKLEAVDSGISTLQSEFLAFIVTPDGTTVGENVIPHLVPLIGAVHYELMPGGG
jgi:hypothetical protein